ncbi:MAG: ATP-binding cassette domain-containing protein [Mariprofundaceae bacterium]|nr:ATP-binding cassette domain-containing protein [Mariprofundaceae bacterium]
MRLAPSIPNHSPPISETNKPEKVCIEVHKLSLQLSGKPILHDVSFTIPSLGITSLIGPSGAGKSSLLRCLNRLYDDWKGNISMNNTPIKKWHGGADVLRQFVGLIAQKPSVFPVSIAENVTFGLPRQQRQQNQDELIQSCLKQAALWNEVKDRLHTPANTLSLGQQQRLCLARALALKPAILLLDEPTSSLDPLSKELIECSITKLAISMPIICVTHDLDQAARLQGQVVFMCDGKVIETGESHAFFTQPKRIETREFLRWSVCECAED